MKRTAIVIGLGMALGILIAPSAQTEWWEFWESSNEAKAKAEFERVKRDYEEAIIKVDKKIEKQKQTLDSKKIKKSGQEKEYLEPFYLKKRKLCYETIKKYEKIIKNYPESEVVDDSLYEITWLYNDIWLTWLLVYGYRLNDECDKAWKETYSKASQYADRLLKDYSDSKFCDDVLYLLGRGWLFFPAPDGAYVEFNEPLIKLVKDYPKSEFALPSLFEICKTTENLRSDIYLWARKKLLTDYKEFHDKPSYLPCVFPFFGKVKVRKVERWFFMEGSGTWKEEINKLRESVIYISVVSESLYKYKDKVGHFPKGEINDGKILYKILYPYIKELFEQYKYLNPFEYGLKLNYYRSDGYRYKCELEIGGEKYVSETQQ
jgi:hypothetical protein